MRKFTNFMIGAAVGAAVGLAVHYLLGPGDIAEDGEMVAGADVGDVPYRSRLDTALDAGRQAAKEREAELIAAFEESKQSM